MALPADKTQSDLAWAALRELRIARADEEPSAEDARTALDAYAGLYEELTNVGLAWWAKELVPLIVYRPLAKMVAHEIAAVYGKSYDPQDAMIRLRAAAEVPWDRRTIVGEYY